MNAAGADHRSTAPPEDLVRAYLQANQGRDVTVMRPLLTDDFVLESPYNLSGTNDPDEPDGSPWRGIDQASANFERAFENMVTMKLVDVVITPTVNPNVVFAEASGDMMMATGSPYKNKYVYRFDLQDGKVRKVTEYRNPVTAAIAFGRPLPGAATT